MSKTQRQIRLLQREVDNIDSKVNAEIHSDVKIGYFGAEPTLKAKVDAIAAHLGITFEIAKSPVNVVKKKGRK